MKVRFSSQLLNQILIYTNFTGVQFAVVGIAGFAPATLNYGLRPLP